MKDKLLKGAGPFGFINSQLVTKFGVIIEVEKRTLLKDLFLKAESEAFKQNIHFKPREHFLSEIETRGPMIYAYRYYTPKDNLIGRTS